MCLVMVGDVIVASLNLRHECQKSIDIDFQLSKDAMLLDQPRRDSHKFVLLRLLSQHEDIEMHIVYFR